MLVLAANLLHLSFFDVLARSNHIDVGGSRDALTGGEEAVAVVGKLDTAEVCLVVGELAHLTFQVDLIEIDASMPYTDKGKTLGVGIPAESVHIGVERCADI